MVADQPAYQNSFVRALAVIFLCHVLFKHVDTASWLGEHKGGQDARNPGLGGCKNESADQPAHSHICYSFIMSIISKLTTSEIQFLASLDGEERAGCFA